MAIKTKKKEYIKDVAMKPFFFIHTNPILSIIITYLIEKVYIVVFSIIFKKNAKKPTKM